MILTFIFCHLKSYAQTNVSGGIFSNTTWTVANSPYIVTDDVVVFASVTLTIEPGVIVKFNDAKGLEIRGNMQAIGNSSMPIVFTSSSSTPAKGNWEGIKFINNLISTLKYIEISYAKTAIHTTDAVYSEIDFENAFFSYNYTAVYAGKITNYTNCRFENNSIGIEWIQYSKMLNCDFSNNAIGIKYVYDTEIIHCNFEGNTNVGVISFRATFIGNTFINNNTGLDIKLFTGSVVTNNLFKNNDIGIKVRGEAGSPVNGVHDNCLSDNSMYNVVLSDNIGMDLSNNYWGTTDPAQIENGIWHAVDDISLGLIVFSPFDNTCEADTSILTSIADKSINGPNAQLKCYPNPVYHETTITFWIEQSGFYSIRLVDLHGRTIKSMEDGFFENGNHKIFFQRENWPNGIYFVRLESNYISESIQVLITE